MTSGVTCMHLFIMLSLATLGKHPCLNNHSVTYTIIYISIEFVIPSNQKKKYI